MASVSATDLNTTEEVISLEDNIDEVSVSNNDLIATDYTPTNSSEIQSYVNNAKDGDNIIIKGTFVLTSTIKVNKKVNFIGKDHATIDGNSEVQLFYINVGGVTFKDITFKNGYGDEGGAIYSSSKSYSVQDCTFTGNHAKSKGGAIYGSSFAVGCTFISNSAYYGGAMYDGSAVGCTFTSNSVTKSGGAMYRGSAVNCSFNSNSVKSSSYGEGGAMYRGSAVNCSFNSNSVNASSSADGGAMYYGSAVNCSFNSNRAYSSSSSANGGAMYYGSAIGCNFTGNHAKYGDALYYTSKIVNCDFRGIPTKSGFTIYTYDALIDSCNFTWCHDDTGGTIYCRGQSSITRCNFKDCYTTKNKKYITLSSIKVCDCVFDVAPEGITNYHEVFLEVNDLFINKGDDGLLLANLTDYDGAVSNQTIIFRVNDIEYNETTDLEGIAKFNITEIINEFGVYDVQVSTNNSLFYPISKKVTFCIISNPTLSVNNLSIFADEDGVLVVNLSNSQGVLAKRNIVFYVGDKKYSANTDINGSARFNVTDFISDKHRNYSVGVSFEGDAYNNPVYVNASVVFYWITPVLTANDLTMFATDSNVLVAKLSNSRGLLINKTLIFSIGGKKFNATTDSEGLAKLYIENYSFEYKNYSVNVSFEGDSVNNPVSTNANLISGNRLKSSLSVNSLSILANESGVLVARLSNSRGLLINKTVIFSLDGEKFNATTDFDGLAMFKVTDFVGDKHRNYSVGVGFDGDLVNNPVCVNASVKFQWFNPVLAVNNLKISAEDSNILVARLSNSYGPVVGRVVSFYLGGSQYNVTTDLDGLAKLNIEEYNFDYRNYPVNVSFEGDSVNNPVSTNANILTGLRKNPYLSSDNISIFVNQAGELVAKLSNSQGPLFNRTIIFAIDGKKYNLTTDETGLAKFNTNNHFNQTIKPYGNYSVRISFEGDLFNYPASTDATVSINRYDNKLVLYEDCIIYSSSAKLSFYSSNQLSVKFDINGTSRNYTLYEGHYLRGKWSYGREFSVSYILNGSKPGVYNFTIEHESDYYTPCILNGTVFIRDTPQFEVHTNYTRTSSYIYVADGDDEVITFRLYDYRGPIANKLVYLESNYKCSGTTDSQGFVTINLKDYFTANAGSSQSFTFVAKADNYDTSSSVTVKFFKVNYICNATIDCTSQYYGDAVLVLKLIDLKTNQPRPNARVVLLGNELYTDENGTATYVVPAPGTYNMYPSVKDSCHVNNSRQYHFEIYNIPTELDVYQENNTLRVKVYNSVTGTVCKNTPVTLTFDNAEVKDILTNDEGIATYKMRYSSDTYHVVVNVSGTYMDPVREEFDAVVSGGGSTGGGSSEKVDSKISFSDDIVFDYGKSGSTIVAIVGGYVKQSDISVDGHAEVNIELVDKVITVSGLNPGSYTLRVKTTPNEGYYSVVNTLRITVNKNNAAINVKSTSVAYKKSTKWSITLKDSVGAPISDAKLTLKVYTGNKYKNVSVTTNANGIASYQTNGLSVGDHKVVISFTNPAYNCKAVTSSVKVIKQTPLRIILHTSANKKGGVISMVVKDKANKKYFSNVKLKLMIYTGSTYKTIDLVSGKYAKGKGVCAYATNMLSKGTHKVKVITSELKYSGSATSKVVIKASAKKYRNWWEKISKGKKTSYGT